jgi:hypothetical protein
LLAGADQAILYCEAAFTAVVTMLLFSLDLKQEIQIQIQMLHSSCYVAAFTCIAMFMLKVAQCMSVSDSGSDLYSVSGLIVVQTCIVYLD